MHLSQAVEIHVPLTKRQRNISLLLVFGLPGVMAKAGGVCEIVLHSTSVSWDFLECFPLVFGSSVLPSSIYLWEEPWVQTSTPYKAILKQDEQLEHTCFILNSLVMTHMESLRTTMTLWRLQTTLCYMPATTKAGTTQRLPCLSPSSSPTCLGSSQVGCPQRSRYDPLSPGLQLHPNHQPKRFLSNTDLPPVTRKGRKANSKSSYQDFQNPADSTPGWRTSFEPDWSSYLFV